MVVENVEHVTNYLTHSILGMMFMDVLMGETRQEILRIALQGVADAVVPPVAATTKSARQIAAVKQDDNPCVSESV